MDALDRSVRRIVLDHLIRSTNAPAVEDVAREAAADAAAIVASYRRLADAHIFILQDTGDLMAANPFAAIPTPFEVASGDRRWSAMCIWDALGIPAMLGIDAEIRTTCGDCNGAMTLRVENRALTTPDGYAHFAVPAKRWWDNIVFS